MESTTPTFTRFWPSYVNASAFGRSGWGRGRGYGFRALGETPRSAGARWGAIAAVILGGTAVLYAASSIERRKRGEVRGPDSKLPHYSWFVLTPSGRIAAGYEYRNDAKDFVDDNASRKPPELKVVSRKTLVSRGVDPDNMSRWTRGGSLAGRS